MANAWNEATWGQNAWGEQSDVNEILTGEALTSSLGNETITADCNVTPTGVPITATEGTVTEIIAVEAFPSGLSFTANLGTADASPDAIVSGVTANASVGSVEAYNLTGWGRYFYGQFVWGATGDWAQVDLTGISLSANLGTVDAAPDAEATGIGFSAALAVGTVVIGEGNVAVTGEPITATLENVIAFTDVDIDITGIEMSAATNPEGIPSFTAEADAQLSTAQAKFGPSSLLLDGTGDFIQSTATDVVQNNFTIEFFAYASNFVQDAYLWDNQSSSQGFAISITSAGQLRLIQDGTILQQTGTPSLNNNQWNHFALVQNSTLLTLYINGTPKLQYSTGGDSYPGQSYKIGANEAETQFFNGYIDEFRSSDIARYTGLFTPPTSPFTVDGNTISLLHFDGANGSTQIFNETQNAYSITGTANTDVTGEAMTAAEGIVDPAPDAEVTGIGFDASLAVGTVVIGEANVTVVGEGFAAGLGVGTLDAVTLVDLTGISMSANIGTITAKGFANVSLTGFGLTMAEGTNRTLIWNQVNTGTAPTWTEVDTAA